MFFYILIAFVIVQRLAELKIAKKNEQWMKQHGAIEAGQSHYFIIVTMHTLFILSLILEVLVFGARPASWYWIPLAIFITTQLLRVWALTSLGRYWNTKILVLPKANVIARGPYRFMKHPNYIVVVLEILALPLIFQAYMTAAIFSVLNAIVLLFIRIPVEEKALSKWTDYHNTMGRKRSSVSKNSS